jgi:hypothetical protein
MWLTRRLIVFLKHCAQIIRVLPNAAANPFRVAENYGYDEWEEPRVSQEKQKEFARWQSGWRSRLRVGLNNRFAFGAAFTGTFIRRDGAGKCLGTHTSGPTTDLNLESRLASCPPTQAGSNACYVDSASLFASAAGKPRRIDQAAQQR